jgi:hypothetical protein
MNREMSDEQALKKLRRKRMVSFIICYPNLLLFLANVLLFTTSFLKGQPIYKLLFMVPIFYTVYKTYKNDLAEQNRLLSEGNISAIKNYLTGVSENAILESEQVK